MNWKDLAKYFVHGLAFSLLYLVLAIVWALVVVFLVSVGYIIGLVIGIGLLFVIVGFLNSAITSHLWFEVKTSFLNLFFHGLALFIALLIVNAIFVTVPFLVFPGTATSVITFVISAFLDGFVAKKVAGFWKGGYREAIPKAPEAEWRAEKRGFPYRIVLVVFIGGLLLAYLFLVFLSQLFRAIGDFQLSSFFSIWSSIVLFVTVLVGVPLVGAYFFLGWR